MKPPMIVIVIAGVISGILQAAAPTFAEGEKAVPLFNGRNFDGWEGHIGKYWSIEDGVIVGRNAAEDPPPVSTYLLTTKAYHNFRLIYEGRLVESEMHTGVAIWGKKHPPEGDPYTYQGHMVMFPHPWGYYDLFRRNFIVPDDGRAAAAGRQHDWNKMEILAIGNRIQYAVNGYEVADWTDPEAAYCGPGPIGLQLHSNTVAQRVEFKNLTIAEDPQGKLLTAIEGDHPPDYDKQFPKFLGTWDLKAPADDGGVHGGTLTVKRSGKGLKARVIGSNGDEHTTRAVFMTSPGAAVIFPIDPSDPKSMLNISCALDGDTFKGQAVYTASGKPPTTVPLTAKRVR